MLYPVCVYPGDARHAHTVAFPDFSGCHTAADEWGALPGAIQEAVQAHHHGEGDEAVPPPSTLDALTADPLYRGGMWMPADLVQRIDRYTRAHHLSRSGFLARAAMESA